METKKFEGVAGIEREFEVVSDDIVGKRTEENKLYMVVWERLANSGIIYCWAKDENNAYDTVGFSPKFVKHTIVEINPESMPVQVGVQG